MRSLIKFMSLINQFKSDEKGAALIEYTVLLAILLVAVIAIIAGVGKWVSTEWASLSTTYLKCIVVISALLCGRLFREPQSDVKKGCYANQCGGYRYALACRAYGSTQV